MTFSVYPDMNRIFVSGRRRETRRANSRPFIPGMTTSVSNRWMMPLWCVASCSACRAILGFENRISLTLQRFEGEPAKIRFVFHKKNGADRLWLDGDTTRLSGSRRLGGFLGARQVDLERGAAFPVR